jgi:hypothetical protein
MIFVFKQNCSSTPGIWSHIAPLKLSKPGDDESDVDLSADDYLEEAFFDLLLSS